MSPLHARFVVTRQCECTGRAIRSPGHPPGARTSCNRDLAGLSGQLALRTGARTTTIPGPETGLPRSPPDGHCSTPDTTDRLEDTTTDTRWRSEFIEALPILGRNYQFESIQKIEVKTSGVTAEFSRGQGGFANIIMKSGGNEFKGTFKFFWRGLVLDGDGAGIDDPQLHGGLGENGLRT